MKNYVKIISLFLMISILFSCVSFSAFASDSGDYHSSTVSWWDSFLYACVKDVKVLSSVFGGKEGVFGYMVGKACSSLSQNLCNVTADNLHYGHIDYVAGQPTFDISRKDEYGVGVLCVCDYCGSYFVCYSSDLAALYYDYTNTLDTTEASYTVGITGFSATSMSGYNGYYKIVLFKYFRESSEENFAELLVSLGINSRVLVYGMTADYLMGIYWNASGKFSYGLFDNPYSNFHCSYLGVYDKSSLTYVGGRVYTNLYHPSLYGTACSLYPSNPVYVWDGKTFGISGTNYAVLSCYFKPDTDSTYTSSDYLFSVNLQLESYFDNLTPRYHFPSSSAIVWNRSATLSAPTGADQTSRYGYLMHLINDYNTNNSYQSDPNAVNVYISKDDLSDLYSMDMFSEETLIFTEPETGKQYQCENWTYDYNLRSYALDLVDGSMTYNGSAVDGVTITYGDDAVTIRGWAYGSSSTLSTVYEDTYNYVAVSQSECALSGHSYDHAETPATCTNYGESVDTCTVCGETDREIIPALGHDLVQSVLREPSCSLEGVTRYDCSRCDYSYTGSVPAVEHDFQSAGKDSDGNALYVCSVCGLETTDYTGEGPITDQVGWWSWLQGWLTDFKEWLGERFENLGDTIENSDGIDIDQDVDIDYTIIYDDSDGVEQQTSIMKIIDKFAFLTDIYDIGDTMLSVVRADAFAAYAVDDGGSVASSGAPTITVDLSAANSKYGYVYGGSVQVLDLSWYSQYKERVDSIVSGFLWLLFLWGLFKSAPAILGGVGLAENRMQDISSGKKGGRDK